MTRSSEDQWKATPKLTVNLGVGWTYFSGPYTESAGPEQPLSNAISIFNLGTGQWQWAGTNPVTGAPPNLPPTVYSPHYGDFDPNAGIAYQVTSRTVLRSGFSMAYDHGEEVQEDQALLGNYPYGSRALETDINLVTPSQFTFTNAAPPPSAVTPDTTPAFTTNPADNMGYVMQWNAGVERELTPNAALSINYVGTGGRDIYQEYSVNTATYPAPGPLSSRQPYPQFGVFSIQTDRGKTNYNALQVMLKNNFSHGLTFQASYTWSRSLGDTVPYGDEIQNPYDVNAAYGPLNYDQPQMFVGSWVYQLPFGHGKHWLSGSSRLTNLLLGGWNTSGIVSAYMGTPLSVTLPFDNANTGSSYEVANVVGPTVPSGFRKTRQEWFDTADFAVPPEYTFGDAGNGIVRGPGYRDFDFALYKQFNVTESKHLQFRFESFNVFNFTNLNSPNATIDTSTFGEILSASAPREIQFALKFIW